MLAISNLIDFKDERVSWIFLIAAIVLIYIIISIDSINENKKEIKSLNFKIDRIQKDLNILERLSKIEAYFEYLKMKKRGQINWLDLVKIAAIIILGYIIIRALTS